MPDERSPTQSPGGPQRAPRSFVGRLVVLLIVVLLVVAAAAGLAAAGGILPSGTGTRSLVVRAAVALALGGILVYLVRRMLGALAEPPPPPPPTIEATTAGVVYECSVCGTRLRLEVAATTKAPKHCGEEMEATIG